jgi:hypothetical protein
MTTENRDDKGYLSGCQLHFKIFLFEMILDLQKVAKIVQRGLLHLEASPSSPTATIPGHPFLAWIRVYLAPIGSLLYMSHYQDHTAGPMLLWPPYFKGRVRTRNLLSLTLDHCTTLCHMSLIASPLLA